VKYSIVTFGCRVNQADSLAIESDLLARGATSASPAEADLVVVNTCSVTASADQGARQTIRRIVRDNPDVQVVVTGCYATRRPDEVSQLPNVTLVVPNRAKDTLVHDLPLSDGKFVDGAGPCGAGLIPGVAGRTAFTLRVQTGCDEHCSYCIIPTTRGPGRSRPLAAVRYEIERAVAAGYKEIAITGVHLGSYGRDTGGASLEMLVAELASWPDDVLFRISSLEPMDCSSRIVELVAGSPRLAPHFHLPLQHGSDAMLRAMRRPYSVSRYVDLVERIAASMPHASIGTDLIVGFPGESELHFDSTRAVLTRLPLSHVHVFPYSDRSGTEASERGEKVEGSIIRARGAVLREIGARLSREFRARQEGTSRRALTVDDGWSAVTDNYVKVRLPEQHARNEWTLVTL
jgi:threonylcarbamoyladenosine tRNA methylthiotransferase MtaB